MKVGYALKRKGWKVSKIIEDALKKVSSGDLSQAPFPLVGAEARIYLNGAATAYQHALEMMPDYDQLQERLRVAEAEHVDAQNDLVLLNTKYQKIRQQLQTDADTIAIAKQWIGDNPRDELILNLTDRLSHALQRIEVSEKQEPIYQLYSEQRGWADIDKQSYDNNTRAGHKTRIVYAALVVPAKQECNHDYHYFGDQKIRRCNKCCCLEDKPS